MLVLLCCKGDAQYTLGRAVLHDPRDGRELQLGGVRGIGSQNTVSHAHLFDGSGHSAAAPARQGDRLSVGKAADPVIFTTATALGDLDPSVVDVDGVGCTQEKTV